MPIFTEDVAVNSADGTQMIRLDANKPTAGLITPLTHERIRIDGNVPLKIVRIDHRRPEQHTVVMVCLANDDPATT